jgi:hypothetical protein
MAAAIPTFQKQHKTHFALQLSNVGNVEIWGYLENTWPLFEKRTGIFEITFPQRSPELKTATFKSIPFADLRCRSALCRALCYFAAPVLCFHAYFVLLGLLASPLSFRGSVRFTPPAAGWRTLQAWPAMTISCAALRFVRLY